jgi:hypothetical protein
VTLEAGRRDSGGIPAGAAAGPVREGPGRSPSSPRSGWALGFGRGNHRRAAHRQPVVAATAATPFPVRAARWGGGARRQASTSAREGDRCLSWGNRRSDSVLAVAAFPGAGGQRGWPRGGPATALNSRSGSGSVASK